MRESPAQCGRVGRSVRLQFAHLQMTGRQGYISEVFGIYPEVIKLARVGSARWGPDVIV